MANGDSISYAFSKALITTMTRKANAFHKAKFEESDSLWELDNTRKC